MESQLRSHSDHTLHPKVPIILTIDVGSSSTKCRAYQLVVDGDQDGVSVRELEPECSYSKSIKPIDETTGKIKAKTPCDNNNNNNDGGDNTKTTTCLFDDIDSCVDQVLEKLRHFKKEGDKCWFHVVGVALSSFTMNLIGVDRQGNLVGNEASMSYACNSSGVGTICHDLKERLTIDELKELHQQTGCPLHSAYALPQLIHYYNNHHHQDVYKWQTIASIILCRWTGRTHFPISYSEASWTGLLDVVHCEWSQQALNYLPQEAVEALPTLKDCIDDNSVLGGIRPYMISHKDSQGAKLDNPYWNRWPELRGLSSVEADGVGDGVDCPTSSSDEGCCRLFLGIADGACANVGSKCTTSDKIAVTIGTSAAARMCIPFEAASSSRRVRSGSTSSSGRPRSGSTASTGSRHTDHSTTTLNSIHIPDGLWCYRITKYQLLLGGALTDGGSVVEWATQLLNLRSSEKFDECMTQVKQLYEEEEDSSSSEVFVPFLNGERSTGYRSGATAVMMGLTRQSSSSTFMKSCLEGVILRLNEIVERIVTTTNNDTDKEDNNNNNNKQPMLVVSGTALEKNVVWRQMLADATQLSVVMDSNIRESTSRGAALLVGNAIASSADRFTLKEESLDVMDCHEPCSNKKRMWDEKSKQQQQLIQSVEGMWKK